MELCEHLLAMCPLCCPLLEITAELYVSSECADKAVDVWIRALADSPCNAHVFHQLIKCLHAQVRVISVISTQSDVLLLSSCSSVCVCRGNKA